MQDFNFLHLELATSKYFNHPYFFISLNKFLWSIPYLASSEACEPEFYRNLADVPYLISAWVVGVSHSLYIHDIFTDKEIEMHFQFNRKRLAMNGQTAAAFDNRYGKHEHKLVLEQLQNIKEDPDHGPDYVERMGQWAPQKYD